MVSKCLRANADACTSVNWAKPCPFPCYFQGSCCLGTGWRLLVYLEDEHLYDGVLVGEEHLELVLVHVEREIARVQHLDCGKQQREKKNGYQQGAAQAGPFRVPRRAWSPRVCRRRSNARVLPPVRLQPWSGESTFSKTWHPNISRAPIRFSPWGPCLCSTRARWWRATSASSRTWRTRRRSGGPSRVW